VAAGQKARGDHAADVAGAAGDQNVHGTMLAGRGGRPVAAHVAAASAAKKGEQRA
jgi:hypothetical protein